MIKEDVRSEQTTSIHTATLAPPLMILMIHHQLQVKHQTITQCCLLHPFVRKRQKIILAPELAEGPQAEIFLGRVAVNWIDKGMLW